MRQQMKWFVLAVGIIAGVILVGGVITALGLSGDTGDAIGGVLFMVGVIAMPVSITIAILRYRLYDIDVVINKTLVYGALSALLALAYIGLVALLQAVLPTRGNDLAVAASTLAAAALFAPLRRRIQSFVDQRFYRRRYDAAHTIEEFSARLRDEVDLEELRSDLLDVVGSTMQPAHASLWLRSGSSA